MNTARSPFAIAALALGLAVAGCGSSSTPSIPPSALHETVPGSSVGRIVLSPLGAQRIGVQTALVRAVPALAAPKPVSPAGATVPGAGKPAPAAPTPVPATPKSALLTPKPAPKPVPHNSGPKVMIPYSAIVYDPDGNAYTFAKVAPLTYVEVPIAVDHISGSSAYLLKGPRAGARVVSVGAEELFGVQTGVLAQT